MAADPGHRRLAGNAPGSRDRGNGPVSRTTGEPDDRERARCAGALAGCAAMPATIRVWSADGQFLQTTIWVPGVGCSD